MFGNVISVFSEQVEGVLRRGGDRYALYCFIIALLASVAVAIQNFAFGASAEHLSRILRVETFSSILRQDVGSRFLESLVQELTFCFPQIAFFDKDENSTGHLTSSVSDWAQKVQGLLGITSGVIIQSICESFFSLGSDPTDQNAGSHAHCRFDYRAVVRLEARSRRDRLLPVYHRCASLFARVSWRR